MSERERWAYEELQVGDAIQDGDQWLNPDGRWQAVAVSAGPAAEVWCSRVRRPYRVSTILEIGDALAGAQKAATQLQDERDNALAALRSAQRARNELQLQVDELRANRTDEPTARQVQNMLRTWATELDWSGCCFDSIGRDKVSAMQRVLVSVIERIGSMIDPEGSHADD